MTNSENERVERSPSSKYVLYRSQVALLKIIRDKISSGDVKALYPTLRGLSTAELPTKLLEGTAFEELAYLNDSYGHLELRTFGDLAKRGFSCEDIRRLIGRAAHYGKDEITGAEIIQRIGALKDEREAHCKRMRLGFWASLFFPEGGWRLWNVWQQPQA